MRTQTDHSPAELGAGQDERIIAAPGHAGKIVNMRWDPQGWWANDRGWEPLLTRPSGYLYPPEALAPIRFFRVWSRSQGAECYYIYEQDGDLQYEYGNDFSGASSHAVVKLDQGRHIPQPDDPGTQLIPYGRFALFLNGFDAPLKFFGAGLVTPFGFPLRPSPPVVVDVDPEIVLSATRPGSATGVADGTCAIGYPGLSPTLLGNPTADAASSYAYKFTLVSDTGSESPLSDEVVIGWTPADVNDAIGFAGYVSYLPTGPDNIVARRLYRTKNLGNGTELVDRTFYFVAQINDNCTTAVVDCINDSRLIQPAPSSTASTPLPPGLRYGAAFDGRLWLAGGDHSPTRVWYSEKNAPEQFGALSFFDLGDAQSGSITQVAAYDGRLVIFRERGINTIEITQFLQYKVGTLSTLVGTTASNTIKGVPGFGLVFLSRDGIYSLAGSAPVNISNPITQEMKRIGAGSLARSTACWSTREGEYWVQYPADGATENTRGSVLTSALSKPSSPAWSFRHVTPTDPSSTFSLILTAMDTDPDGWVVFGVSPIDLTTGLYPGTSTLSDLQVADVGPPAVAASVLSNVGLQIWSARPAAGTAFTVTTVTTVGDDTGFEVSTGDATRLESVYQSAWYHFDTRTRVISVEVWMVNTGRPDLTFEFAADGREVWTDAGVTQEAEPYETSGTTDNDHVYATDDYASKRRYEGVWGTSIWREDRVVRLRWDVKMEKGALGSFAFRIRSSTLFAIVRHRLDSTATGIKTRTQASVSGGT